MPLEGTQLGQYRLLQLIGSGGMGEVYLAEDARINQQVAIKVSRTEVSPYPDASSATESARLFQREARAIAQLDHPRILPLFSYGEEQVRGETLTYIVMPYRREGSLVTWLRQRTSSAPLNPQDVAAIVTQAADALQYAHDHNVIHQDVKPANFLVRNRTDASTTIPDLLLTDFGIAKLSSATSHSSHAVRGTATYMAPEQWIGDPVPATDQYALAIMAYELLTGRPPFQGRQEQLMYAHVNTPPQPPSTLNPRLSGDIDRVLLHALAKKPEERFRTIAAFANAFQQAVQGGDAPTVIKPMSSSPVLGTMPTPVPATIITSNRNENPGNASTTVAAPNPVTPPPNYAAIQAPVKQKRHSSTILFVSIICVLLIILASFGVYFVQNTGKQNNSNANNQALNATGTAGAIATTTKAHNRDATATAINTSPYPPPGATLALNDPLSDNNQGMGWEVARDAGGACTFYNGKYQVTESQKGIFEYCPAHNSDFKNFAFEVQMLFVQGDAGGLFFTDAVTGKYYYFDIDQNGNYMLRVYIDASEAHARTLTNGIAPMFTTGSNQTNVLAVVVNNGTFYLYINKRLIGTASDSNYHHGSIGVFIREATNSTEAIFSNAKVWTF